MKFQKSDPQIASKSSCFLHFVVINSFFQQISPLCTRFVENPVDNVENFFKSSENTGHAVDNFVDFPCSSVRHGAFSFAGGEKSCIMPQKNTIPQSLRRRMPWEQDGKETRKGRSLYAAPKGKSARLPENGQVTRRSQRPCYSRRTILPLSMASTMARGTYLMPEARSLAPPC